MRSGVSAQLYADAGAFQQRMACPACRWADTALAKGGPKNPMRYVWPVNAKLPARVR